jgi:aminopeptidase-like protein
MDTIQTFPPAHAVRAGLLTEVLEHFDANAEGAAIHELVSSLYPICRSITGSGLRESLRLLQRTVPMSLQEVQSGSRVFDWVVPNEWNIRDAYIMDADGRRVVDFHKSNLHVVGYSIPVRRTMPLSELRPHLHTLPDAPDWIPYRTTYYNENWGFCMRHRDLESLRDGAYEVCIDSTLAPGHLTYGEFRIQGATDDEVLISCHSCHPSLCNDNLSGMSVATRLAHHLAALPLRYSYRFLWIPGTVGAITWLATHEEVLPRIKHGLVLSCVGDPGRFTYKQSRRGQAEIDRIVVQVLKDSGADFAVTGFTPTGYDERQYCSPGINLPVGCFMRTPNGQYPQYHTSADDLTLVTKAALAGSLRQLLGVIDALEANRRFVNLNPKCEPQLGRRGLYRAMGGTSNSRLEEAILWVLSFSDGAHSLLDIAERSNVDFRNLRKAADLLLASNLLAETIG